MAENSRSARFETPAYTALITGATAGLGAEFAQQLAASGHSLVLVARNAERLEVAADELRTRYAVDVETLPADLLTDDGAARVVERLEDPSRPVSMLINNAGYGLSGNFADNSWADELAHLRIHTEIPLRLAHAAINAMAEAGGGRIINVASVAAFTPRGTYSAAKALMVNFSRWANVFYKDRGVHVLALCPGFVKTEFHERMKMDTTNIPEWSWLNTEQVVREGLTASNAGAAVSIPSSKYRAAAALARIAPDSLVEKIARRGR